MMGFKAVSAARPPLVAAPARRPAAAAMAPQPRSVQVRPGLASQRQRLQQRQRSAALACRAAAVPQVDVEAARKALDGPTTVLDVRPEQEWEEGRITKPPRKSTSAPYEPGYTDGAAWLAGVAAKLPSRGARIIVMCSDGGAASSEAAALLAGAGYSAVEQLEGGYAGYSRVWSPSGKRRPPAGRWVPTGKEALKSALNVGDAAASYEEGGNAAMARWANQTRPDQ